MIDVLHREIRSDTLYIYAFRDAAETELRQEAAWLYRDPNQPEPPSDTRSKRVKWFSPFVLPYQVTVAPVSGSILPEFPPFLFLFLSSISSVPCWILRFPRLIFCRDRSAGAVIPCVSFAGRRYHPAQ